MGSTCGSCNEEVKKRQASDLWEARSVAEKLPDEYFTMLRGRELGEPRRDGLGCPGSGRHSRYRYGQPERGLWEAVLGLGPCFLANSHACVTVFAEGNLYAVGGYDSSSHLATVEKYEPQVNIKRA